MSKKFLLIKKWPACRQAGMCPYLLIIAISIFLSGIFINSLYAEETKDTKITTVVTKTITGEISGISSNFIAVEYGMDPKGTAAREIAFDLDKDVKLEHKNSLQEIGPGDTVRVAYDDITVTDKDGKLISSRRKARVISFVKSVVIKPETEMLDSEMPPTQ